MARPKKVRGRPQRPYPPRIDATPDQLLQAMLSTPPNTKIVEGEYKCSGCQKAVNYPEILYNDNRCSVCHEAAG